MSTSFQELADVVRRHMQTLHTCYVLCVKKFAVVDPHRMHAPRILRALLIVKIDFDLI